MNYTFINANLFNNFDMKHESLNEQGIALLKKNQFNEAKLFFEKAIELKSDFSDAINNLGLLSTNLAT